MPKRTRSARAREHGYRRRDPLAAPPVPGVAVSPPPPAPLPRVTAPAQRAGTPVTTRITMTDYGYVVGELRRIALLTALILVLLIALWLLLR